MRTQILDALGRDVTTAAPPTRVVSLVPSETESVVALVGIDRVVGRTEWCEEPRGIVERVPTVGGTKKLDVERVVALAPDLVLANQEENGRADVEALIARGLTVHVSFPRTLEETAAFLESLAALLHVPGDGGAAALRSALARPLTDTPVRVFAPIWKDPWMTFDARTYASDLLVHAGAENVFADRARRYPLAADLDASVAPSPQAESRDTRYPRFALGELASRAPDLVLLPDEPYRFSEIEADELRAVLGAGVEIRFVCGKDLFWYGTRSLAALERVRSWVEEARG